MKRPPAYHLLAGDAKGQRGIVLMDVMAALALLATMAFGIFLAFRANLTTWLTVQQYAGEQENGRAAVNQVARSLRMLGYSYAPTPTSPAVIYADPHEIDFLPIWIILAIPSATACT
jgi:Tfp pilus assembly protein PilW